MKTLLARKTAILTSKRGLLKLAGGMVYLLRDEYTTDRASAAINATSAEPGGTGGTPLNTRTAVDTGTFQSIASGALTFTGGQGGTGGDPRVQYGGIARVKGRALSMIVNHVSGTTWCGFFASSTVGRNVASGFYTSPPQIIPLDLNGLSYLGISTTRPTQVMVILRTAGSFVFYRDAGTTGWALMAPANSDTTATLYPAISNQNGVGTYDSVQITDIPGFDDWQYATYHKAAPAANDTALGHAVGYTEMIWTPAANEVMEIDVRRADDNNRIIARFDQAAGTTRVVQVDNGVETLGTTSAQTFTVGTAYRIVVSHVDTAVRTYVNATAKASLVVSANATNRGVKVRGFTTATHLATWARNGYGTGSYPVRPAETMTLIEPTDWQTFQRSGTTGSIRVKAILPTVEAALVEYQWCGGAWTTIATVTGGWLDTTLTGLAQGQGTFSLRCSGVTVSASYVGIGELITAAGQSNADGRGNNAQVYSHATLKATLYSYTTHAWGELVEVATRGSVWPLVATDLMATLGVPVGIIKTAVGGTSITTWQPATNHYDVTTNYGFMAYYTRKHPSRVVAWWDGETDAVAAMSQATHNGYLDTLANAINTDLGIKLLPCLLQTFSATSQANQDAINAAIIEAAGDNANVLNVADLRPLTSDDTYHLMIDAKLQSAATLIGTALKTAFGW